MKSSDLLATMVEQQGREDAAAAAKLVAVTDWADAHRLAGDDYVESVEDDIDIDLSIRSMRGEDASVAGCEAELRLAGQGAFMIAEFAVTEVAAALRMSEPAARTYVGQGVELRDRLSRLWGRVMSGDLPAWKGLQIAEQTIPLNDAAAGYVDAQLAPFAHKLSLGRILKCVEAAILRHDPDLAAQRAAAAADKRGVWAEHRAGGVSELRAVADTPDVEAFDTALDRVATATGQLGDTDPHQARRAKALGILADPQYALDLLTNPGTARASNTSGRTTHIHLHTDSLADLAASGVARVDGVGPQTPEAIKRWLNGLTPGASIKVTPVVDLNRHIAVDAYEIPDRLRHQIEHRDVGCVFPWCGRRGRHDLDHIDPYLDPDDGGPPGQTSTSNLARLCRFDHRVKTHGNWTYRRHGPTTLEWTSPHGRTYTVDHTGTINHT